MASNYEVFLESDLKEYTGKWVAIADGKIVASGSNAKKVMEKASLHFSGKKIMLIKVPEEGTMIY